ncbi:MAG TPA: hypothetical protein VIJ10_00075 [Vicinamibacteria bacterium]
MAIDRVQLLEHPEQATDVRDAPSVDQVEVGGQDRSPAQYPGHHADHDELNVVYDETTE